MPRRRPARRITRRGFLALSAGAATAGLTLARLPAIARALPSRLSADSTGDTLIEPPVRASKDGLLQTGLQAKVVQHQMAGQTITSNVYEGMFPAPTLKMRPGDTIKIRLDNQLDQLTNLHLHGFHVSPSGNSDNIFLHIQPGQIFDYEYHVPADHPAGLYWYHPHFHTLTTVQVFGGMAGAIIIDGGLDEIPGIAGARDRLLLLHATQIQSSGIPTEFFNRNQVSYLRTVNGQINPTFTIRPGELQRLRIGNISDGTWFRLKLDGHQMIQIAKDGNPYDVPVPRDEILMAPAERIEVMVRGGAPGSYALRTLPFDQGFAVNPDVVLATMVSQGDPVTPVELPAKLIPLKDLRTVQVDRRREISFQVLPRDDPQRSNFLINSQLFDENRVDFVPLLNATEEWVLKNPSNVFHPFHIHINPFQVISINGQPVDSHSYEDTVTVPWRGEVVMRTQFLDYTGRFVFHCHILPHEDGGMMSVVEVVSPDDPLPPVTLDADVTKLQVVSGSGQQFTCPLISTQ
jgi:FtsP/CotA-like multicopper oxidase with cupredoxin domain